MTTTITPYSDAAAIEAARLLDQGALVAVPTETVYGVAADAANDMAVARIFEAKGRPGFNPLIVHVDSLAMAQDIADFPATAGQLAAAFWPGPLTLVLPLRADAALSKLVTAGLGTVAIRCPAAEPARAILAALGRPFAAPSANPSGGLSPTTAAHVAAGLGDRLALILDNGPCALGVESTILRVGDRLELLRPGSITPEDIRRRTGLAFDSPAAPGAGIVAPGMLESHYAPRARLRLMATGPEPGEAFLGFGRYDSPGGFNLSPGGDLVEAAANLFAMLHRLDARADRIAVAPIPDRGLGRAINDRLRRAAAPRPSGS